MPDYNELGCTLGQVLNHVAFIDRSYFYYFTMKQPINLISEGLYERALSRPQAALAASLQVWKEKSRWLQDGIFDAEAVAHKGDFVRAQIATAKKAHDNIPNLVSQLRSLPATMGREGPEAEQYHIGLLFGSMGKLDPDWTEYKNRKPTKLEMAGAHPSA